MATSVHPPSDQHPVAADRHGGAEIAFVTAVGGPQADPFHPIALRLPLEHVRHPGIEADFIVRVRPHHGIITVDRHGLAEHVQLGPIRGDQQLRARADGDRHREHSIGLIQEFRSRQHHEQAYRVGVAAGRIVNPRPSVYDGFRQNPLGSRNIP